MAVHHSVVVTQFLHKSILTTFQEKQQKKLLLFFFKLKIVSTLITHARYILKMIRREWLEWFHNILRQ